MSTSDARASSLARQAPEDGPSSGGAARPDGGPRFALRFEAGRGVLSLARPLTFGAGVVEVLEIDLGRLPGPIDLRGGASAFRHRRGVATRLELRVDLDALSTAASAFGIEARALATVEGAARVSLADGTRTLAMELVPAWDGDDLVLAMRDARAALDGPRTVHGDALAMLNALGAPLDRERGVVRIEDPMRRALTEALVPYGYRVPILRGTKREAPRVEGRALRLRVGDRASAAVMVRAALEEARTVAPVLAALAIDREDLARQAAREIDARGGAGLAMLDALRDELERDRDVRDPGLALRVALAARDVESAARNARVLASSERCDEIAIEGLRAAARLAREDDPATAADLAARALARRPRDPELALEWLERAAATPEASTLVTTVRALATTVAGPRRGEVMRAAAAMLERAGELEEAGRAWDDAARLDPSDASALEGVARSLARRGRLEDALASWDRAAAQHEDPEAAGRATLRAAELAEETGHAHGAASRLERVAASSASIALRVEAWVRLAAIRRRLGAEDAAVEADIAILDLAERLEASAAIDALRGVARAAIERGAELRARAAIDALRRAGASDVDALDHAADALALDALEREAPEQAEGDVASRALAARRIAERLRASGRFGDAARALARAGVLTRDAATLRAALELAEKAGDWDAALDVIDRAIEVVGAGPARAQLESRRAVVIAKRG